MADPRSLSNLQRWVQEVITHPDGIQAGVESSSARQQIDIDASQIEQIVERSTRLGSAARLAVYGNAYFARLIECLGEEFPATRYALGEETFESFAFGYIHDSPSTNYSLGFLGERFAQYLIDTRPTDVPKPGWPDFLIDLATLERTYAEVFDGPGPENLDTLKPEDLQAVPPDRISEIRFVPVPSLRLIAAEFPVHEYVTAVRRDQSPEIPMPAETLLVITRRDYVVRRGAVSQAEFQLLRAIIDGNTLGQAIEQAAATMPDGTDDELATNLSKWFQHWASAGWFLRVELPSVAPSD
ncbi:MAG: putative DNA-binding domain-containing protein [Rhodopirellula sp.]|nr:putative DNA-binding domain-containing protein [Rhodopirellula sp.]